MTGLIKCDILGAPGNCSKFVNTLFALSDLGGSVFSPKFDQERNEENIDFGHSFRGHIRKLLRLLIKSFS